MGVEDQLRSFRGFIGGADSRKLRDLSRSRFLVEPFGIPLLAGGQGSVYEDLHKGEPGVAVERAHRVAVFLIGGDEAHQGQEPRVGEQFADLGDSADVLLSLLGGEAEICVEAVAYIITVEAIGRRALAYEKLLKGHRYGAFSRAAQAGEPESGSREPQGPRSSGVIELAAVPLDVGAFDIVAHGLTM